MDDRIIFKTKWIKVRETQKGFQFLERDGVNSIAVFLIREGKFGWEVLVRYQPLCIQNNDDSVFPCPITGSIEYNENYTDTVIREIKEETGFIIDKDRLHYLDFYIVGTQTNESVFMYWIDVTDLSPEKVRGDGSYHESISYNKWEDLVNLRNYKYSACQIGYYKLNDILNSY